MSKKNVPIKEKPRQAEAIKSEAWIERRKLPSGKMKRINFDIPEELHRAIKTECAMKGVKICDEIRILLQERFEQKHPS